MQVRTSVHILAIPDTRVNRKPMQLGRTPVYGTMHKLQTSPPSNPPLSHDTAAFKVAAL